MNVDVDAHEGFSHCRTWDRMLQIRPKVVAPNGSAPAGSVKGHNDDFRLGIDMNEGRGCMTWRVALEKRVVVANELSRDATVEILFESFPLLDAAEATEC